LVSPASSDGTDSGHQRTISLAHVLVALVAYLLEELAGILEDAQDVGLAHHRLSREMP
jgi:hypothetical protein